MEEKKYRILVVDDEQNIQKMIQRYFRLKGYEVDTADNGKIALETMTTKRYDVVISDIKMPVMDGTDLLREVKKQYPMTHVIMITGYVTLNNALTCMRLGAKTCIFKPIEDMHELEDAVEDSIAHLNRWEEKFKTLIHMKE
ncbi:MAG: response regulator [Nitrospirae bacterium]|nr:response regulator [Nitrospirota bacterium]MBF0542423.1 response regulator [Nitrospirota bacterium]